VADEFRRKLDDVGHGGIHCYCCNCYHGNTKNVITRKIRRIMKHQLRKESTMFIIDNKIAGVMVDPRWDAEQRLHDDIRRHCREVGFERDGICLECECYSECLELARGYADLD
jgi:hypothetical protein